MPETNFVWIPKLTLRPEMERQIETPANTDTLASFLDEGKRFLGDSFGPAMIAWASMYSLNQYQHNMDMLRHFNLPLIYGEPMAGKTLIATCAAWLNGCPKTAIASR